MIKQDVYDYLLLIPHGKVVTYGQIACSVGCPGGARAVGNILHSNPDPDRYPCFRVVNRKGRVSENFGFGGKEEQIRRLAEDGIEVTDDKVNLEIYGWNGIDRNEF